MEEIPIEQGGVEVADIEEPRARQSELVNLQAVQLYHKLVDFLGPQLASPGSLATVTSLPPAIVEALEEYLEQFKAEMEEMQVSAAKLKEEKERSLAKAKAYSEKAERVRCETTYFSEKYSASLKSFREQLKQSGEMAKERNRELAAINRKREKAEMDIKRTDMELQRLRKVFKHAR